MNEKTEQLLLKVEQEMGWARDAEKAGNYGKARVCARRAVGWLVQGLPGEIPGPYGTHIMENLRMIVSDATLPEELRSAAERLQGGNRAQLEGALYSQDPVRDAGIILEYFMKKLRV